MELQSKHFFALAATVTALPKLYAPSLCLSASWYWNVALWYLSFVWAKFVWSVFVYPFFFSPFKNLPQPAGGNFIFGHALEILRSPSGAPHRKWITSLPNEGIIYYRFHFNQPRIFVTSPKAIAEVTSRYEFIKPQRVREGLGRVLGIGILLAEGEEHRHQRRLMGPAFGYGTVRRLVPIFWQVAGEMVKGIEEQVAKQEGGDVGLVDVDDWASRATLDIIGLTGLSRSFHAVQNPDNELYQTYRAVFSGRRPPAILQLAGEFIPLWILRMLPLKRYDEIKHAVRVIKTVAGDLVVKKRAEVEEADRERGEEKKGDGEEEDTDILTMLIRTNAFSNSDLVNQVMTLLAAGHETTASALTWALYLLCHHPDTQTALREEIRSSLPSISDPNSTVTASQLDSCKLLNAVMNETLRLFPPVPLTLRVASKDTTITNIPIPKGTQIAIVPWATNHSPALWSHPDYSPGSFHPERWLQNPGSGGADSNYAFGTFIHGPRSCIGREFARCEFAALLAAVVGRLEWRLDEGKMGMKVGDDYMGVGVRGGVTARPERGLWCRVSVVEGW